jgi:hypothetical protein
MLWVDPFLALTRWRVLMARYRTINRVLKARPRATSEAGFSTRASETFSILSETARSFTPGGMIFCFARKTVGRLPPTGVFASLLGLLSVLQLPGAR